MMRPDLSSMTSKSIDPFSLCEGSAGGVPVQLERNPDQRDRSKAPKGQDAG